MYPKNLFIIALKKFGSFWELLNLSFESLVINHLFKILA